MDGLGLPLSVTVSPNGDHVYVACDSSAVVVFARDVGTGALRFVEVQRDGVGGVDGLNGAHSVAVTADGHHVYVASFRSNTVSVFARNEVTGALSFVEVHPDGVAGVEGLSGARAVTASADGRYVYVGGPNTLVVFAREVGTGALTFVEAHRDGVGGVEGLIGLRSVTLIADDQRMYVASSTGDVAVAAFTRDAGSGTLSFSEVQRGGVGVTGLDGAVSVAVSADGRHAYVASQTADAVAAFQRDPVTGRLNFVNVQRDGVNGVDGLDFAHSVTVSPDGRHVYVAAARDGAVAVFRRDADTGALTLLGAQHDGADDAFSLAVSPDGRNVYVASSGENALAAFARDADTETLSLVEVQRDGGGVDGLAAADWVTVSPDGSHVYVTGDDDNAVAVFAREGGTGSLHFVEAEHGGIGGVDELIGPFSATVSGDGRHVYVASGRDDALEVFARDPTSGALQFVEVQRQGVAGVDGLSAVNSAAVSPDGSHVFVASGWIGFGTIAVFARDTTNGKLTFVEVQRRNEVSGVDGLDGAFSIAVSPDGRHVYVASFDDDTVAVFRLNK